MYDLSPSPDMEKAKNSIDPKGYKLLIAPLRVMERTKGGILLPDQHKTDENVASVMGQVVAMGESAYQDSARFPNGPWCQVGDVVLIRSYAGTRLKIGDTEFRVINDDTVEAVIKEPSIVERA